MVRSDDAGTVVTPGNHDGVHLGHRALLDAARSLAAKGGQAVVALTFDPHPAAVVAPERAPALLTTLPRRRALLRQLGADRVEVLRFDRALANEEPEAFVSRVLVEDLGARGLVVGGDFRFGRRARGDVTLLRELGIEHRFEVRTVSAVEFGESNVSSTRIRGAVTDGNVEEAATLLGRLHEVEGTVVEGHRRGRTIGVPTANLDADPILLPADGVYAVVAHVVGEDDPPMLGVANLGVRPTVGAGRSVEVHLLDFDRDLYGARLRVGFQSRLRDERRFDGLDALKAQITTDIADARAALATADQELWRWIPT